MELEPSNTPFEPVDDKRPRVYEPPPVRLMAVNDCLLPTVAGQEVDLDRFYVDLLKFERDVEEQGIVYRAENYRLRFEVFERRESRVDFSPLGVMVPSLANLAAQLSELEIEFTRQRGITPGSESFVLLDPSGNVLEITEYRLAI